MTDPDFWPNSLAVKATSPAHKYTVKRRNGTPELLFDTAEAMVKNTTLGQASLIDRIIFDRARAKDSPKRFLVLSLWADSMEFNLVLPVNSYGVSSRCIPLYVPLPKERIGGDKTYWNKIFNGKGGRATRDMVKAIDPCCRIVWNEFSVTSCNQEAMVTERVHIVATDPVRSLLQTVPLLTKALFRSENEAETMAAQADPLDRFRAVYHAMLLRADWISVVRGPTLRNLVSLSAILLDKSRRVTLVSGLPGTGKEAFSKAIHYGDRTWQTQDLVETTGPALARCNIAQALKDKIDGNGETASAVLIDEFNKGLVSEPRQLSQLLRILEDPKGTLKVNLEFVLAASQHLEELVVNGPQDFWTRVSHVLRVVHPLARVDEDEGRGFLQTFFYSQWHQQVKKSEFLPDRREIWFGGPVGEQWKSSPLCRIVGRVLEASLVPLVVRDVLSVRGVRSMVAQVFSRVRWTRSARQFDPKVWGDDEAVDKELEQQIVEAVNAAVQDVLVVLNESRVTPRQA